MFGLGLSSLIPKKRSGEAAPSAGAASVPPAPPAAPRPAALGEPRPWREPVEGTRPAREEAHPAPDLSRNRRAPASPRKASGGQEAIFQIEVHLIKPNPYQPRREVGERELLELAQSIRDFGILQPLVVSKAVQETESGTVVEYELIAGERRLLAAKRLGWERVPAVVRKVDESRTKLEMALIENLQRSDLNALETARAYARLQDEFGLTQREIAARVGKSREVIANTLRLLDLPQGIGEALAAGRINESQARALLSYGDAAEQDRAFHDVLSRGGAARRPHQRGGAPGGRARPVPADPEGAFWERKLEEKFGAPVRVVKKGNRGKIEMRFQSEEEWHGLVERLVGEGREE